MSDTEKTRPQLIVDYGVLLYIGRFGAVSSHDCAGTVVALGLERDFALKVPDRVERARVAVVPAGLARAVDGGGALMAVALVDPDFRVRPTPNDAALLESVLRVVTCRDPVAWQAFRRALGLSPRTMTPDSRVATVAAQLRTASDDVVPVSALAAAVGLSVSRLEHLFSAQVGCPIRSFRTWCRFRTVAEVAGTGGNITMAAHAAGFHDSAHLAHAFRQSFGLPPSAVLTPALEMRPIGHDTSGLVIGQLDE